MIIHPYRKGSKSVHNLKEYIRGRGLKFFLRYDAAKPGAQVINWGSNPPVYDYRRCRAFLNDPKVTKVFTNKLHFFQHVEQHQGDNQYIPSFMTRLDQAQDYLDHAYTIVERHVLGGMSGEGIRIVEPGGELQQAPLYVKYEKKTDEFRIHIAKNKAGEFFILHHQKKVARDKNEVKDWKVRNHDNGFFFQQHGYDVPDAVSGAALGIIRDCFPAVDFVALDVIYHKPSNRAYVLEGNTAPGLEGTSVEKYGDYFIERFA